VKTTRTRLDQLLTSWFTLFEIWIKGNGPKQDAYARDHMRASEVFQHFLTETSHV
jgi:hypothetical protein